MDALSGVGIERSVSVPALKDYHAWLLFCLGSEARALGAGQRCSTEGDGIDTIESYKQRLLHQIDTQHADADEADALEADDDQSAAGHAGEASGEYPVWTGAMQCAPTTKLILQFDQVLTQKIFVYLVDYLSAGGAGGGMVSAHCAMWIYALLSHVEKPLHRDVVAVLRQFYRHCCALRHRIAAASEARAIEDDLARLNMLIVIVGYYFGQGTDCIIASDPSCAVCLMS
jgi:hypothetical protein